MSPALLARNTLDRTRQLLRTDDPTLRMLWLLAAAFLVCGLFHIAVWLLAGTPSLAGPVSWRKPIIFGLSTAVTTASLAWMASWLPASAARRRRSWVYAVTMALEILLIDVQAWRGVASHFNNSSVLDGAIFAVMGVLILVSMAAVAMLGRLLLKADTAVIPADVRLAGLLGVGFVMVGAAIGIGISVHGSMVQARGTGTPSMVGAAGQLKSVHAVALHGLQFFPVLAFVLGAMGIAMEERRRRLAWAGLGYGLVFLAVGAQALMGRAPSELVPATAVVLLAGVLVLVSTLRPARGVARASGTVPPEVA